ncbi:MAG: hypothetical protein ACO3NW_06395, partial [Kiritimatiellia bacterium]
MKTSFLILVSFVLTAFPPLSAEQVEPPLEYWLADQAPFWSWDPDTFAQQAAPLGFRWMDEGKQASRAAPLQKPFFDQSVMECVVRFENDSPQNIMISYFNRGDARESLTEAAFQEQVRTLISRLTRTLRVQPRPGTQNSSRKDVRDDSWVWQRPEVQFELSFSYSPPSGGEPFRAEFIRLIARRFRAGDMPAFATTTVNPYAVKNNIRRDPASGEVWIENIPMVDQGPKGYCAAATSERILRFFGHEVDQHQIAQIANTTSSGGTSSKELKSALQAVGRQYDFSFSTHLEWDFRDFMKTVERYNRAAVKKGLTRIEVPETGVIMIGPIYGMFDPETYLEVRMENRSDFNKFKERVKKYIDAECPLSWSVQLG